MVGQPGDVGLVVGREGTAGREIERRQVLLLELDGDGLDHVAQAAAALEREGRPQVGRREDAAVRSQEPNAPIDGLGQPQVLAEVDRDRLAI